MARANNAGSIYRDSGGQWWAKVSLPDGRRSKRKARTNTEAGAERQLAALDRELAAGTLIGNPALTLGEYLGNWLSLTVGPNLRASTAENYQQKLEYYVLPTLSRVKLSKLTPDHLRRLYRELGARTKLDANANTVPALAPQTIKTTHTVLHRALEQARRDRLITENVAGLVSPPKVPKFRGNPFTLEEAVAFLEHAHDHRHGPLWTTLLGSGMRFGEVAGLQLADVDLPRRVARVHQTLTRPRLEPGVREWKLTPVKTDKSDRALYLPLFVVDALREELDRRAWRKRRAGELWNEHQLVFASDNGLPIRENHVLVKFHRALKAAGIDRRRMHDLRGSTATLLFDDDVQLRTVSEMLGHSTIQITSDRYVRRIPRQLREAADRLDTMLGPKPRPAGEDAI